MKNMRILVVVQFFFSILSCESNKGTPVAKNQEKVFAILSSIKSIDPDSVLFETFLTKLKLIATPCSTNIIVVDTQYRILPFDKNIKFLNGLDKNKVVDYEKKPTGIPCGLYHNNCSKQFVGNLNEWYYKDSIANEVCGLQIASKHKNIKIFLCYAKAKENDVRGFYNTYLLVFSVNGEFLSAIETNCRCTNKVASIIRKGYVDTDLNIYLNEYQKNNECDEGDFEAKYHYKITKLGQIEKKSERVEIYKK